MPSASGIATKKKKKKSADKPAHAHLRRFNITNNLLDIIVIMYFWRK